MQVSTEIRKRQALEILRAGRHAWAIERDLNVFVVINFICPPGDEYLPKRQFQKIRKKARSWLYNKRGRGLLGGVKKGAYIDPITDMQVWENEGGRVHVNWAIHIPEQYRVEFDAKLPIWIAKVIGDLPDRCYKVKNIYNINGLMRYVLKGTTPEYARKLKIRHKYQGEIYGRRAQPSGCLGRAARLRAHEDGMIVRTSKIWKAKNPA